MRILRTARGEKLVNLSEYADVCGTDKGTHQGFMEYYPKYLPAVARMQVLVELGVYEGGSMKLWGSRLIHPGSRVIGVDIDLSRVPRNPNADPQWDFPYDLPSNVELYEGDQTQVPELLERNFAYGADTVIDDASHFSSKTIASFHTWWPRVRPGGLYVVEDTHCSYNMEHYGPREASSPEMDTFGGNYKRTPRTTMAFLKRLADDVNWNYHGFNRFTPLYTDIAFVHHYPGICFIGKASA